MRYTLIFAVAIAVLGFVSAIPTRNEKEKMCEFLKDVEIKRFQMLESLSNEAWHLGMAVIRKLPENSGFKKCIEDDLTSALLTQTEDRIIDFLRKFKCVYKQQILRVSKYQNQPEFRQMYNRWNSANSDIIIKFENKIRGEIDDLDTSDNMQNNLVAPFNEYFKRTASNVHEMFDRFLNTAKSNYECTFELELL